MSWNHARTSWASLFSVSFFFLVLLFVAGKDDDARRAFLTLLFLAFIKLVFLRGEPGLDFQWYTLTGQISNDTAQVQIFLFFGVSRLLMMRSLR